MQQYVSLNNCSSLTVNARKHKYVMKLYQEGVGIEKVWNMTVVL